MECQSRHHALLAKKWGGGATAPPALPAPACLIVCHHIIFGGASVMRWQVCYYSSKWSIFLTFLIFFKEVLFKITTWNHVSLSLRSLANETNLLSVVFYFYLGMMIMNILEILIFTWHLLITKKSLSNK